MGVLAADSGRYIAANEYACELTGYERAELIGRHVDTLCEQRGNGIIALGCKGGAESEVSYQVFDAELSGIPIKLSLFWPV